MNLKSQTGPQSHRPIHGQNIQLSRCSNQTKCHLSYSNTKEFFLAITIVYIKSITCSIIHDIFAGAWVYEIFLSPKCMEFFRRLCKRLFQLTHHEQWTWLYSQHTHTEATQTEWLVIYLSLSFIFHNRVFGIECIDL